MTDSLSQIIAELREAEEAGLLYTKLGRIVFNLERIDAEQRGEVALCDAAIQVLRNQNQELRERLAVAEKDGG